MPITSVRTPTGEVIQVQHPEGATDAEILAYAQRQVMPRLELPKENLLVAGLAGASRGALGLLDVLPRGISGALNVMGADTNISPLKHFASIAGIGTRQPQTPAEERAAFVGEILGASVLPGGLATRAAAVPARAAATETVAAGGAVLGGLVGGDVGGPVGQTIGTLAGGLSPMAAPWAARTAVSPLGQRRMAENLAAAERQNVPMSAGQAAGGSMLEKASATLPGGAKVADTFAERQAAVIGERVEALARQLTSREASAESAGRAITKGLDEWIDRFKANGEQLFGLLDDLIPPTTQTNLRNTRGALENLITDEDFSRILDSSLVRDLNTVMASKGTVSYEVARSIRSRIGEKLSSPELVADISRGQAKNLYAALSRDLEEVAETAGPNAQRVYGMANRYWKAGMQRIDDFLDPIARRKVPEAVYKAAMSGTKEGASRIRALKKSLNPEQWNVVVATTLRRLGRAIASKRTEGDIIEEATDFSPQTFLTNIERLDAKARKALFSGSRYEALEADLRDLRTVAAGVRGQQQTLYNPSGTAPAWWNAAGLAPFVAAPFSPYAGAAAAGILGNVGLQKALQTRSMANYLANPTQFSPAVLPQVTREAVTMPDLLSIIGMEPEDER